MRLGDEKLKKSFERFGFDKGLGGEILMEGAHLPAFGKLANGDLAQTGIGSASCGPEALPKYKLYLKDQPKCFTFRIEVVTK